MLSGSYLDDSYLGGSAVMSQQIPNQPVHYAPDQLAGEMITLPGGITIPRSTLLWVAAAVAVAILLWKMKRDK